MSIQPLLNTQTDQLEDEIRQDVIEIRRELPKMGYRLKKVYREKRGGLIFCALYELNSSVGDVKRVIGYPRVSMYQQSGNHSLMTQVKQMLALAAERGQTITRFYVEAGLSGGDSRRPAFQAMMRDAPRSREDGSGYSAVYCYDLYRFYRSRRGVLNNYDILSDHGVSLVSVAEKDIDLDSKLGQMIMSLRSIMGEMYLDDLSRTVRDNKASRAMKGYSNASIAPFGYCRGNCSKCADNQGAGYCPRFGARQELWRELGDDQKIFVPHPIDQHAFRIAAALHVTGEFSDTDIARQLSRPFPDVLEQMNLDNRTVIEQLEEEGKVFRVAFVRRCGEQKDVIRCVPKEFPQSLVVVTLERIQAMAVKQPGELPVHPQPSSVQDVRFGMLAHRVSRSARHAPQAVFVHLSTNKVYGDAPNRLPLVEPNDSAPEVGHNTTEALQAGVCNGVVYEVDNFINSLKNKYNGLMVIMTGGDAFRLTKKLKKYQTTTRY